MRSKDQILLESIYSKKVLKEDFPKIPSDGYADGGEPYDRDELEDMNNETPDDHRYLENSKYDHRTLIRVKSPIPTSNEYHDYIKSKDGNWFKVLSKDEDLNPPHIRATSPVDPRDTKWLDSELQKDIDYINNSK